MKYRLLLGLITAVSFFSLLFFFFPKGFAKEEFPSSVSLNDKSAFKEKRAKVIEQNGFVQVKAEGFAVSRPVKEIPITGPIDRSIASVRMEKESFDLVINPQNEEQIKEILPGEGAGRGDGNFSDPLLRCSSSATASMPAPSLTFEGNSYLDNSSQGIGGLTPPDTTGDVGPNHYVQAINVVFSVYDKHTGERVAGPLRMGSLWSHLPYDLPCKRDDGDPVVIYDSLADRWVLSQFSFPHGIYQPPYYQCVAVSKTGDPAGEYNLYTFYMPGGKLNDYPKLGVWTDAYYMTDIQYLVGYYWGGTGVFAFDRAKMIAGDPNASFIYTDIYAIDPKAAGLLPSDIDGVVPPPPGLPNSIIEFRADEYGDPADALRIYELIPDFNSPGNSTIAVKPDIPLAPFDARQPSGLKDIEVMEGANVDALPDRLMYRVGYRNLGTVSEPVNSYVGNFTVNVSGISPSTASQYQAGIRWFELRRAGSTTTVFDQGTHNLDPNKGDTGANNWMGSIAQDGAGNLALGFSQSSTTQRADIKWAGRTNNQPGSNLLNEGENTMYAASGAQTSNAGRWGDYSTMTVDPEDDCTFYYSQEYYPSTATSNFYTRIGKFKFSNCIAPSQRGVITGKITFCETGLPLPDTVVQTTAGGYIRGSAADGTYKMVVVPGTYNLKVSSLNGYLPASQNNLVVENGQTVTADFCLAGVSNVSYENHSIIEEGCSTPNASADPGEIITVKLDLRNTGTGSTSNLTATLQPTGGVMNPSDTQNYGAILFGTGKASRSFTFKVNPNLACGNQVTLTWILKDGNRDLGTVVKKLPTGTLSAAAPTLTANFDNVTPPALPSGWSVEGYSENWATKSVAPYSQPNSVDITAGIGTHRTYLISPPIKLRAIGSHLKFRHWFHSDRIRVGMAIWMRADDGQFYSALAHGATFPEGGYNTTITDQYSPLYCQSAWGGISGGGDAPVYIESVMRFPDEYLGKTVQINWVMGSGGSPIAPNTFRVDDVQILANAQCQPGCSQANAERKRPDFDGDGITDISIFRPANGEWWYRQSTDDQVKAFSFGTQTDRITPADYDGDGKTDIAFYRPATGEWFVLRSSDTTFYSAPFGVSGDIASPGDFDGDGKADLAVFRSSQGIWFILNSTGGTTIIPFGANGDMPQSADYDGDGKTDICIFRPVGTSGASEWWMIRSSEGLFAAPFGTSSDRPVPADYTGDGKTDIAYFKPATGEWFVLRSEDRSYYAAPFGLSGDIPVPGDYDGDGLFDMAVFRPSSSVWYLNRTERGIFIAPFGATGDIPVPSSFIP